jgi:hypothetical protein
MKQDTKVLIIELIKIIVSIFLIVLYLNQLMK